jgi:lysine 6-dehydrogenase
MKILVLGGGAQGSACALDLARTPGVKRVVLADVDVSRPRAFLAPYVGSRVELTRVDADDAASVRALMDEADGVACALPYYFNAAMSRLAVAAGSHFCDLGGNTEIVDEQMTLAEEAAAAGVSVVPDCGLAPGMVNVLAQGGIDAMDETRSVRMLVGGLPQDPVPPLNYQVVYSMEGVLDYYTTPVLVLEGGEVVEKEALTGVERVDFREPVGELEAFLTAGGVSRMPYRYRGEIAEMTYKTLRYPGHAYLMKSMRDLGLFDIEPLEVDGQRVSPRDVFIAAVTPHLVRPQARDFVAMRVVVEGTRAGAPHTVTYEMLDLYDAELGVTAMMRTTGYSLAAIVRLQVAGDIRPGVHAPWECVPADTYVRVLGERGVRIERRKGSVAATG